MNTGPTPAELAAMVEAMTPGPWDFHDPQIRAKELHRIIAPVRQTKKVTASVAVVTAGLRSNAEMDSNGVGIVALRNFSPAMWKRYQEVVRALETADVLLSLSEHNGCSGHQQVVAAIANANNPLEAS